MPRNVRNFWLELYVDGRQTRTATGPVSKDGGFQLDIYRRNDGEVEHAYYISGQAQADGTLFLSVYSAIDHKVVATATCER